MNRRSSGFQFSKAFLGSEQYKAAEGLSPNTLVNYRQHLRLFLEFGGDVDVGQVTSQDIRAFLAWQRTDRWPKRLSGDDRPLLGARQWRRALLAGKEDEVGRW